MRYQSIEPSIPQSPNLKSKTCTIATCEPASCPPSEVEGSRRKSKYLKPKPIPPLFEKGYMHHYRIFFFRALPASTIHAKHRCSPANRLQTAREGNTTLVAHPVKLSRITGVKVRPAVNHPRMLRRNDSEVSKLR